MESGTLLPAVRLPATLEARVVGSRVVLRGEVVDEPDDGHRASSWWTPLEPRYFGDPLGAYFHDGLPRPEPLLDVLAY
jgi:hypothetical protein